MDYKSLQIFNFTAELFKLKASQFIESICKFVVDSQMNLQNCAIVKLCYIVPL